VAQVGQVCPGADADVEDPDRLPGPWYDGSQLEPPRVLLSTAALGGGLQQWGERRRERVMPGRERVIERAHEAVLPDHLGLAVEPWDPVHHGEGGLALPAAERLRRGCEQPLAGRTAERGDVPRCDRALGAVPLLDTIDGKLKNGLHVHGFSTLSR